MNKNNFLLDYDLRVVGISPEELKKFLKANKYHLFSPNFPCSNEWEILDEYLNPKGFLIEQGSSKKRYNQFSKSK